MDENEKRQMLKDKFAKLGIKNAGTMGVQTIVAPTIKNVDKYQKLMSIKSGANKSKMQELVHASHAEGAPEIAGSVPAPGLALSPFVPLKVHTRKRPGEADKGLKVPVAEFKAPSAGGTSGELGLIANMFNERPGRNTSPTPHYGPGSVKGNSPTINMEDALNSAPTYNHELARERMRQKLAAEKKSTDNPFLQYSLAAKTNESYEDVEHVGVEEYQTQPAGMNIDMHTLKQMMESIAKGMMESIAKKSMKEVLDSYLQQKGTPAIQEQVDKNAMPLKYVGKDKESQHTIVMDDKGKYYKLVPVSISRR